MSDDAIYYYRRGSDEPVRETVLGDRWLRWAYRRPADRGWRRLFFRSPWPSRLLGWYCDSPLSRRRIAGTIRDLAIDPAEFRDPVASYRTFNDFFTRHLKPEARPYDPTPNALVSPADARVLVFPTLAGGQVVPVKGASYTVDALLGRPAPGFDGGAAVVLRLCPSDYHRFHFPCAGRVAASYDIPGGYHSVNPFALALGLNIFATNWRHVTLLEGTAFGRVAFVEVGAFGVAGIEQTYRGEQVTKMQEKGYFKFGGSTVVLVLEPRRVTLAADLVRHSAAGRETLIKVGETLGLGAL